MKRKILTVLAGIAGLAAAYLITSGISRALYWNKEETPIPPIQTQTFLPAAKTAMTEEEIGDFLQEVKEAASDEPSAIRFDELWAMNPDVYAWISIPGTDIDYPVLQHESDDSYYLNHNLDGSYGLPACIYTESLNAKDFMDNNTVIYGHNMKNGTMFAQLHNYEDSDFFEKNREIIIYLPDRELHYRIFAAYVYDDRHLLYSFDFSDPDIYGNYLEAVFAIRDMNANIDKEMQVTNQDKIITLATCVSQQPEKRLLVQAVLTEEAGE